MKNVYGKNVLVTGASRGIGEAVATALAETGCCVTACARGFDATDLKTEKQDAPKENITNFPSGGSITRIRMDVTDESSVANVLDQMPCIDIAICCAGMGVAGAAEELPMEMARAQMETNYFGVLNVGSKVLPKMRHQGKGLFIIIGSIAGKVPIPMQSHYSSSKYALEAYAESLRMEMKDFGVRAVIIEPGDTKTGFTDARKTYINEDSPYAAIVEKSVEKMAKDEQGGRGPQSVAKVVLKLIGKENPPVRVAVGFEYKLLMFILRFLPDRLKQWILSKMYLPKY